MAYGFKINGVDVQDKYISYAEVGADGLRWSTAGTNGLGTMGSSSTTTLKDAGTPFFGFSTIESHNSTTVAVRDDGTLWGFGYNSQRELGQGHNSTTLTPVRIGSDENWAYATTAGATTAAIKTDGSLWMLGSNATGQLGQGDIIHRSVPVQVGSLTNWNKISIGNGTVAAVKTDGTLWTWGYGTRGELGDGTSSRKSSPIQVGSLTNWSNVFVSGNDTYNSVYAIKKDGTLWAWGYNYYGQLGNGNTADQNSPVQIGSDTNWKMVAAGFRGTLAVKTDGTLWAWGLNSDGMNGRNEATTIKRSSPVQVGSLTNWSSVSCDNTSVSAIKTDGTLWVWGRNTSGELGLGDTTSRSSPVQVGSLTNWVSSTSSNYGTFASQKII